MPNKVQKKKLNLFNFLVFFDLIYNGFLKLMIFKQIKKGVLKV